MNILLVEDDYIQAEWIHRTLEDAFPGVNVSHIETEFKFRSSLAAITNNPPDIVILDVMLRWDDPGPQLQPAPPDVTSEGFYRAGLRCQKLLAQSNPTSTIPVILYTVLERADLAADLEGLPNNVIHLRKDSDQGSLIRLMRSWLQIDAHPRSSKPCVFIGHGRSPLWARVQIFLERDLKLTAVSYESESHVGESIVGILEKMLEQVDFAILILTAEDETAIGSRRARQNVIHEAGLFQGKLGFRRAVLLKQDGLEEFTNVDGLQYIGFSGDKIDQTFFELQRVLKRERLLQQ